MLFIIACSQAKKATEGPAPFTEVYDGPLWRDLRRANVPRHRIAALSARYGFLAPGASIVAYDQVMTWERVAELAAEPHQLAAIRDHAQQHGRVCVVGSRLYRHLVDLALDLQLAPAVTVRPIGGSILQMRGDLNGLLRDEAPWDDNASP